MRTKRWLRTGVLASALALGLTGAVASAQEITPAATAGSQVGQVEPGQARMGAGFVADEAGASFQQGAAPAAEQPVPALASLSGVPGMDVSSWQPSVDWARNYQLGARFAFVKATESNWYVSPRYQEQYAGARAAGMLRGSYHFAIPSDSSGAEQARYFVANSQPWVQDGGTLPGILDLEFNPYPQFGNTCYDMAPAQLRAWAHDFATTYRQLTGRYPILYTATSWVNQCLGNISELSYMPLHLARYTATVGPMPTGYSGYDIWQYSDKGPFDGDSNLFNGTESQLSFLALNPRYLPQGTSRPAGLYQLYGAIGGYYQSNYRSLWAPRTNEYPVLLGGVAQGFENHRHVYWHPSTGAHSVVWSGAIGHRFATTGYETGLGFPLTDEGPTSYGYQQWFQTPSGYQNAVYWSPAGGTRVLNGRGAIHWRWGQNTGEYGFPTSDEIWLGTGAVAHFEKGSSIYWSSSTGPTKVYARGALHDAWVRAGHYTALGFPTHDERFESDGRYHLRLSSGAHFTWSEREGTRRLR